MDSDKVINKILWGKSICRVEDGEGTQRTYILRALSISEQNKIDFIYENALEESKEAGILTESQLKEEYDKAGAWTAEDEQGLEDTKVEIRRLKHQIKDSEFHASRKRLLERKLKQADAKVTDYREQKDKLFSVSAEARAEEVARRHMVAKSTLDENEAPIWDSERSFLAEPDTTLILNLAIAYLRNNLLSEADVRKVARSGAWRYRWSASKNGESLFGCSISEWSELQNTLVYWSQYYDYVFENPDRPSDFIINDDGALDAWVESDVKKGAGAASNGTKNNGHQENFIMVPDANKDTIGRVQDMNSDKVKRQLSEEREAIKQEGTISEWNLRKGKKDGTG